VSNTTIIQGEFPGRGELLPYYYYLLNKLFDTAVILHDSVFVNANIDFRVEKYAMIWEFDHTWDQIPDETNMINAFKDEELLHFYNNKSLWTGCFGGMVVITHDFLKEINNKHEISKLLDHVLNKHNRQSLERVIACLLQKTHPKTVLYGTIHSYMTWGTEFHQTQDYSHLPLIKVWTGR
jgi:methyltransferase-like protein